MPIDRRAALADWQALAPKQRQLAWRAAAGTAVIEDRELARVVARYAVTMRGQIPTRHLVAGLLVLVVWLVLAVFLIVGGQPRSGTVLAAIGVLGAGIGIGALQFRQAGFDRLYLASVAVLAGTAPHADEVVVDDEVPDGAAPDGPVTAAARSPRTAEGSPDGAEGSPADPEPVAQPEAVVQPEPVAQPAAQPAPVAEERAPKGERAPQPPVGKPRKPRDLLTDPAPTFYPEAGPRAES
jgi:hypothetical protein